MALSQFLTFPDTFTANLVVPAVSPWLWTIWHFGFPILIIGYLITASQRPEQAVDRPVRAMMLMIVGTTSAVVLVTAGLIWKNDQLPAFFKAITDQHADHISWSEWLFGANIALFLCAGIAVTSSRPRLSALHLCLILTLTAQACEVFCVMFLHSRYTLYWFFARFDGVVASSTVLILFLLDNARLYRDLANANRTLERNVSERTAQLLTALEDRERANRAKNRFLATASHDLRQPVQALRLHLHLLTQKKLDDPAMQVVKTIGETLNSTESMLGKLMEFAALECGKITVRSQWVRLDELVGTIAGEALPEAKAKGLCLRTRVFPCAIETDPVLLERILRNLVSNALRYTTNGGLLIGLRRRPGAVVIAVYDTGIGIPLAMQTAVFEEFEQVSNLERDRNQGMGLGLAIANRTASLLGYRLFLRSRQGHGSMFGIELPVTAQTRPPASGVEAPPAAAPVIAHLMLVEDDSLQANALAAILIDAGFTVSIAGDAITALQTAETHPPDIIVSDYRLPGRTSGIETIRRVRARLGYVVPAILTTGDTQASIAEQAQQEACEIIHKPYSPGSLIDSINRNLIKPPNVPTAKP